VSSKHSGKILALALDGLQEKHEVQRGISVPTENLLRYTNKNTVFNVNAGGT